MYVVILMKNSLKITDILVELQNINIINILSFLTPPIIYYGVKKGISPSYNLRKDFKIKNVNTKILPIEVIRKIENIDETRLLQQKYGSSIVDFFKTISQEIPEEDLTILFNNFITLTTKTKNFKLLNRIIGNHTAGQYIAKDNTIEVSDKDYESTIDHELFHTASTLIDSETSAIFTGFAQIKDENNNIGIGLNEGYTQHLTEKYFGKKKKLLKAYTYEKNIAIIIEMIVGEKQMQSLYLNANLNGLVDVLKQYNSEEKIYDFITTLDLVNKYLKQNINTPKAFEIMTSSLASINTFLLETFVNKTIIDNPNRNDYRTLMYENKERLTKFISLLPDRVKCKKKTFEILDADTIGNILVDIVSRYENNQKTDENIGNKRK